MKRTLQEWSNFLNMYVFVNADGSIYATENPPKLSTVCGPSLRAPLKCKCVYWDCDSNIIQIDSDGVDYGKLSIVDLNRDSVFPEYYCIGWDSSLKQPQE